MNNYKKAINSYLQLQGLEALQLRAVLFDMDGVLFDSMPHHARAWSQVMQEEGYEFSPLEVYLNEGRTGSDTITTTSLAQRGTVPTKDEIDRICKAKCDLFATYPETLPMQGAIELVNKVKACGLTPMIVTGSGTPTLLRRIEVNYKGLFAPEHIITSFNVKRGKPFPDPYLLALEKGGFKPHEVIVVENAPLGVQAGVAAGLFTIAVNTGPLDEKVLSDAGASLIFPTMPTLADEWENLYQAITEK